MNWNKRQRPFTGALLLGLAAMLQLLVVGGCGSDDTTAPVQRLTITSAANVSVAENQTLAVDVQSNGSGLTFSLTGGADQALFSIDTDTGVLTFSAPPDFENPDDSDANNVYEVQVTVGDSAARTDVQDLRVTVTDVDDVPVVSVSPTFVASEIPQVVTITGSGFASTTGTCNVTLSAVGTPFALGTFASITVTGTVVSPTTITFTSPISGVQVDVNADIELNFPSGVTGLGPGLLRVETPMATASSLGAVPSEIPTAITITGSGFAGGTPTVRFANATSPFLGGTASFLDVVGTLTSPTTLTCTTPRAGVSVNAGTTVQVFLTGGLTPISVGPLVTFTSPNVASVSPTKVRSEIPQVVTITGTGFGSATGLCNVTLSAAGAPFILGTVTSLTVNGTVINPTTITFVSPISGVEADVNADVTVSFPTGASSTGAALLLVETPTVTASSLSAVDSEVPTAITITGSGFAGGTPIVRFANATSPFLGGTASFLDVSGTIVNSTTIICTTPLAGVNVNAGATIQVLLTGGVAPISAGPLVTFLAPL